MSVAIDGYRLERIGEPTSAVLCPHGQPVAEIRRPGSGVTLLDLCDWLEATGPALLVGYCAGHR